MRLPNQRLVGCILLVTLAACGRGPFPGDAVVDSSGCTPLMAAVLSRDADAARTAIATGSDLERTWQDRTPLHWAAVHGNTAAAVVLLDAGADIDARNQADEFPLLLALSRGSIDVARELVGRGAEVRNGPRWQTMLHAAARANSGRSIEFAVGLGVPVDSVEPPVDTPSTSRRTALHVACTAGQLFAAEAVMEHGAALESRTGEGWTPLHLAVGSGRVEIVGSLLEHGADPHARDDLGRTIVHIAAETQQEDVLLRLHERWSSETWSDFTHAVDHLGRTPLHLAAWGGCNWIASELLPESNPDARTNAVHWTPAHLAALADDVDLMRKLLPSGVPPPRDALGRTPEDLLLAPDSERPEFSTEARVVLPVVQAGNAHAEPIVRWFRSAGYNVDPFIGHMFRLWPDGVYTRLIDRGNYLSETEEYALGILSYERIETLFAELRETGILERNQFDYRVGHSSEILRVRAAGAEHAYDVWPGLINRVQREWTELAAGAECARAFEILRRVRADVEDPLKLHAPEQTFRGLRRRSRPTERDEQR